MGISFNNDYSFLFGTASSSTASGTFSLSDYAMIKNGTYKKLMKAYYADENNSFVNSIVGKKVASEDNTVEIKKLQSAASALSDSAEKLYENKGNELYKEGNEEKLLDAVSTFVKDYNSMVDVAGSSENDKVLRTGSNMISNTAANYKSLASLGITIGTDNKLSLDEETFKKANTSTVKSVFQGVGSFAYRTDSYASYINTYAKDDAMKASGTYGAGGAYNALLNGSTYNSYM